MFDAVDLTQDLRDALSRSRLSIAYQLQWDIAKPGEPLAATPVMVEALCRWEHPVHGNVPPDTIIPLAEAAGFLDVLDLHLLGRAAAQVDRWRAEGLDIGLAANVSPTQFSLAYAERIAETLERSTLDPRALTIEVTETPSPQLRPAMRPAMELLRSMGVAISVDDFDGSATTAQMLESLPIDEVKIDRTLTRRSDAAADEMIAEVIDISTRHGWRTVAEGIETIDDLDRSRRRHCDRGQGFLWGRPAPADVVERVLAGA